MFSSAVAKPCPFDTYNTINTQFTSIKNLQSFINYTIIPANDLIVISNIIIDSLDKLSELSVFYIKKCNDSTISISTIDKLQKMNEIHNDLLKQIYRFNEISIDVTNGCKDIIHYNSSQDLANYINYNIVNRNKLVLMQIFDSIKKLNSYAVLVKDKL
jgi:hypothetical protein